MAEYTLTLSSEEDYHLIKKILRAFDGAKIKPVKQEKTPLDTALEEAANNDNEKELLFLQ